MASSQNLIEITSISFYDYLFKWFSLHLTDEDELKSLSRRPTYGASYPIYDYPCRVFLVEYDPEKNQIRVWLNERAVSVERASDYIHQKYTGQNTVPCWVCKWIDINPNWLIDLKENLDDVSVVLPNFYRLHGDFEISYGDGGYSHLVYPVWIQERLPLKEYKRKRLLDALYQLNNERRDFHPKPSPVEDIIDPDLLANRPPLFDRNSWIQRQRQRFQNDNRRLRYFERDLRDNEYDDLSEHEQLRDSYQWLPSEFIIEPDGKVDIRTPIHHLPVLPEFRNTYGDIAKIFNCMLPMFEELKVIKQNRTERVRLQVIVKAQSYNLTAGMKYSGRWHTEGQTENIVAVGVYYLHIDEELTGGTLKFRPPNSPQMYYDEIKTDHFVSELKTGAAVVFSNVIPHRFRQIQNLTPDNDRRRTFINFFIVDPDRPIPKRSNEILLAPENLIVKAIDKMSQGRFPDLVLEKIYSFIDFSSLWKSSDEAKRFRQKVRRAMLEEKTGWGWINWGNCGTTQFVRALCVESSRDRQEMYNTVQHTDSDSNPTT